MGLSWTIGFPAPCIIGQLLENFQPSHGYFRVWGLRLSIYLWRALQKQPDQAMAIQLLLNRAKRFLRT